jgi:hypothetical protein
MVPFVCCAPVQPLLAVQLVPAVANHVSVALCPRVIVVGFTLSDAVGAGVVPLTPPL